MNSSMAARIATAPSILQSSSQRAGGETCSPDRANRLLPLCLFGVQTESRPKLKRPQHLVVGGHRLGFLGFVPRDAVRPRMPLHYILFQRRCQW
jgi:hypothetical protein